MALTEDLQIYESMYDLLRLLISARNGFDKTYKYVVGDKLVDRALECITLIHYANEDRKQGARQEHLEKFLITFDVMKTLIMVCRDGMQFKRKESQKSQDGRPLPPKWVPDTALLADVFLKVADIEKQAVGWRRSSRKPESHGGDSPS